VIPFAIAGAIAVWFRRGIAGRVLVLFLVVYAATVVAFFVTARYRVPVRPLLVLFAMIGVATLAKLAAGSPLRGGLAIAGCVAAGFALNANRWVRSYEAPPAQFYQSIANIYLTRGDAQKALEFQLRALALDPKYPDGNLNLGTMYMDLGRVDEAIAAFERERSLEADDGQNLASLGQAYSRAGRLEDADRAYEESFAAGFRDARASYNHGIVMEKLNRMDDAEKLYQHAVSVDSTFADAWINWGVLNARAGNFDQAISLWERALVLRPGDARVLENIERARSKLADSSRSQSTQGS
jgi:tetratricopeptide (TPR) repeat protein